MTTHSLLKRFELITDTPANISLLRRFIIDLAVQGKLIEKSNKTESTPEILRRIADKRELLSRSGKIKKQKPLLPIAEDDIPAVYSSHCMFERLANIAFLEKGLTGIQSAQTGEYPLVITAEARSSCDHFDFEGPAAIIPMVSSTGHGHASLNRLHYQEGKFALGNILCAVFPISPDLISGRFLYEYLTAFKEELLVSKMIGTANVSLTIGKIGDVPIPILSPTIQQRVDELMALCDRLETAQTERESRRDRLVASSLYHLNNGADADAFREHARFYFNHLPRLTTRPDHIKQLRQTILNLAVRGKLVPQDPTDEPAAELLKLSQTKKAQQCQSGELKKQQALADTGKKEPPFEVPDSWCWAYMDDCFAVNGGIQKTPSRTPKENPHPYIGVANVYRGRLDLSEVKQFELLQGELERFRLLKGDILVVEGNGSPSEIGRCAMWSGEIEECVHQNHIIRCRPFILEFTPYALRFLNSPNGIEIMKTMSVTSSGLYSLSVGKIRTIVVPIPSLTEQHRIVAKVDELMALCDQLETQLTTTQTESRHLLEAVLAEQLQHDLAPIEE